MKWYFVVYLVLWTVAVSASLTNATGLGIANLTGGAISQSWGAVAHSLIGFAFVFLGGYNNFEKFMKLLVGVMGFSILFCALFTLDNNTMPAVRGLIPAIPAGSGTYVLSLIGGVGGSITMLSYNYWMREEGMRGAGFLNYVRGDIAIAYLFTAIFGMSIMLIANDAFFTAGVALTNAEAVPRMAAALGNVLGTFGRIAFSVGFWAAVFASLLGVWQSVPYLYADFYGIIKKLPVEERRELVQGDEHAVSARAGLHLAGADSVRLHRPADPGGDHLYDREQPVRAVRRGDAALLEQPRQLDGGGAEELADHQPAADRDPGAVRDRRRAGSQGAVLGHLMA